MATSSKCLSTSPGNPNSLSGVFISSLFKDRSGSLWIGCDEFLDKFDPVTETFTHYMASRTQALYDALASRIVILDGAMGTMIHQAPLSLDHDYVGKENCPEILVVTRPDVIGGIHRAYLEAGADIIETNTFGGTSIVLAEFQLQDRAYEMNYRSGEAGAAGRRRVLYAGQAALRGGIDGSHHEGSEHHGHRHLSAIARCLL